jgi:hypothetical protein
MTTIVRLVAQGLDFQLAIVPGVDGEKQSMWANRGGGPQTFTAHPVLETGDIPQRFRYPRAENEKNAFRIEERN